MLFPRQLGALLDGADLLAQTAAGRKSASHRFAFVTNLAHFPARHMLPVAAALARRASFAHQLTLTRAAAATPHAHATRDIAARRILLTALDRIGEFISYRAGIA
jgi:hypothetical protein